MTLELRVTGPGLDVVRRLEAGEPELVLGRDADCGVCLPDPQRNVSRRHLSVWLEDGALHFRVLSEVNGVETPFADAPPGAKGVLSIGQTLKLAEYELSVSAMPAADADPWAAFDRDGSGIAPVPAAPVAAEDDPFGDWGFETTFGAGIRGEGALEAQALGEGDMSDFFRGLGMDAATLSRGELEAIGRAMRILVLGVLELHASAAGVKQELRAEDRTLLAPVDNNPLKSDWSKETKLRYLFAGRAAGGGGFLNPEDQAVRGYKGLGCVLEVLRGAGPGHGPMDPAPAGSLLRRSLPEGKSAYQARDTCARTLGSATGAQARIGISPLPRRSCCESQKAWPL